MSGTAARGHQHFEKGRYSGSLTSVAAYISPEIPERPGKYLRVASLEAVVAALNRAKVRYILVGGLAVNAHGYARFTADMDLVVQLDRRNIELAFEALESIGYRPRVPVSANSFADSKTRNTWRSEKGMEVLNFHSDQHRETPVDVFVHEPFDFDSEYSDALVERMTGGAEMRIVRMGTLIEMKRAAGRPQDLADIAELEAMHEPDK